jgi:Cu2+-exporting ATPase
MQKLSSKIKHPESQSSYFRVFGMSCPSCAKTIEAAVSKRLKLQTAVDFDSNLIRVDQANIPIELLRSVTQKMGFYISSLFDSLGDTVSREKHERELVLRASLATFFAMWILILSLSRYGLSLQESSYIEYAIGVLFLPILFYAAIPFYRMALLGARVKDYNIDTFITIEIIACVLLSVIALFQGGTSFFDSLSMSLSLLLIGKVIFFKVQSSQTLGIETITNDLPKKVVRISSNSRDEEVELKEIRKGDCIEISEGEFLALDGELISSSSMFDRTKFYGTAQSLQLNKGAKVLAGYQLTSSAPAQVRVTELLGERELDRLYVSTQKALIRSHQVRSLSDRWLDLFIRVTPMVALVGLFISFLWLGSWMESALIALSLLIILCPCAFAFGPPLAFGILRSALAQIGIELRSKQSLEADSPNVILFDKNGTLTQPNIDLPRSVFVNIEKTKASDIAASLETDLEHPLAHAFAKAGHSRFRISERRVHQNQGVEGEIEGVGSVALGNRKLMEANGIDVQMPHGFVHMAINKKLVGSFRIQYEVSPDTTESLRQLKRGGYQLGIITGDNNFESIPMHLFNESLSRSDCSPNDKLEFLEGLISQGRSVAYVGDGVNDSLIMARSKFSFSVSNASEAAKASAAVNFLKPGIESLAKCLHVLKLSRSLLRVILAYALIYNIIAVSFALLGFFNPATALLAMATSSFLILLTLGLFYLYIQMPQREYA